MKKNLDPVFRLGVPFALFRGQKRGYQDTRCSGPSLIWVFSGLKFLWHGKHILSGLIVLFYFFLKITVVLLMIIKIMHLLQKIWIYRGYDE